jgi:hypothetical protein
MAAKKKAKKKKATTEASKPRGHHFGFSVVSKREMEEIYQKADKLAGGNVSRFIRHAVQVCKTHAKVGE